MLWVLEPRLTGRTSGFEPENLGSYPRAPIMKLFLSVVLLLLGCFGQGNLPEPVQPTAKNAKRTVALATITSRAHWQSSGYFRIDDVVIDFPVMIVIADDDTACIIDAMTWASWREGDIVQCKTSWRFRRP